MMTIWKLLKDYVHEFEIANDCKFSDESWTRIKRLEQDIEEEHSQDLGGLAQSYDATLRQLRSQNRSLLVMLQRTMIAAQIQVVDSHTHRAELKDDSTIELTPLVK